MELLSTINWEDLFLHYETWLIIAGLLGVLQFMTDEFFFGGACIGAILTAILIFMTGSGAHESILNVSIPFVLCGVGGILGAILMRLCCGHHKNDCNDINEDQPYKGDEE